MPRTPRARLAASGLTREEYGRVMADRRRQVEHVCPVCGTVFVDLIVARYCGRTCRKRAYRQRQKARPVTAGPGGA